MSGHADSNSDLVVSPNKDGYPPLAPTPVALFQSSPIKPATPSADDCGFTVEELSDNEQDIQGNLQVLHPYELEEVESVDGDMQSTNRGNHIDRHYLQFPIQQYQIDQPPGHTTAPSSPAQANSRKRALSEAVDTDTESETAPGDHSRSEPPRLRRRILGPSLSPFIGTPTQSSGTATPQTAPAWTEDTMDVDVQA